MHDDQTRIRNDRKNDASLLQVLLILVDEYFELRGIIHQPPPLSTPRTPGKRRASRPSSLTLREEPFNLSSEYIHEVWLIAHGSYTFFASNMLSNRYDLPLFSVMKEYQLGVWNIFSREARFE